MAQLFFDERNVVGNMSRNTLKKRLQRHSTIARVNASSFEGIGVAGLQDGKHVGTDRLHHVQFFVDRPSWAIKSRAKPIGISFKERGTIFGKHSLHAVRVDNLCVGQMANNLTDRPFSLNGPRVQVGIRRQSQRIAEQLCASGVCFDESGNVGHFIAAHQ